MIKLFPVISWLVKDRPKLMVAFQVPTHERLGCGWPQRVSTNARLIQSRNSIAICGKRRHISNVWPRLLGSKANCP